MGWAPKNCFSVYLENDKEFLNTYWTNNVWNLKTFDLMSSQRGMPLKLGVKKGLKSFIHHLNYQYFVTSYSSGILRLVDLNLISTWRSQSHHVIFKSFVWKLLIWGTKTANLWPIISRKRQVFWNALKNTTCLKYCS